MSDEEFIKLVVKMRQARKDYFRTRDSMALNLSKRLEREVDDLIERKTEKAENNQGSLFQ